MVSCPSEVFTVFPRSDVLIINSEFTITLKSSLFVLILSFCPLAYTSQGTILVFGDSISAAYGMDQQEGWVHLLSNRLAQQEKDYEVINASVSGETTGGGLIRLPKTLSIHQPDLVILELGGNDGLRGYPIDRIRENLRQMVQMSLDAGARVLLIGMVLPPNYGRRYTRAFEEVYASIAGDFDIAFVPQLLDGVKTEEQLIQRDGIHPRPEAQDLIVEDIWPALEKALQAENLEPGTGAAS
ncbi:MAG: arylesterase [Pseudomonadales bacterium]|nr:arylesterase [Pseudomonadales bacterium]